MKAQGHPLIDQCCENIKGEENVSGMRIEIHIWKTNW